MQNSDISYLLEIQKLENKIGEYVKSIDSHTSRTKILEKQISSKKTSLQEIEQNVKQQKNSLVEKEKELHELEEKRKKSDEHYKNAKSEQQVKALEKELEETVPHIEKLEDEILSLMESIELSEKEIMEMNSFLKGSAESFNEVQSEVDEGIKDDKYAIEVFEKKEQDLLRDCSREARELFLGLKKRFQYQGFISLVEKGKCNKCFFTIPPFLQQTVLKGTSLERCPGCQRLLTPDLN